MKIIDEVNNIVSNKDFESMVGLDILYTIKTEPSGIIDDSVKPVWWSKIVEISQSGKCIKLIDKPATVESCNDEYYRRIEDINIIEVLKFKADK